MKITALALLLALQTLSVSTARRLGGLHQLGGGEEAAGRRRRRLRSIFPGGTFDFSMPGVNQTRVVPRASFGSRAGRSHLRHTSAKDSNGHNEKVTNLY